MTTLSKNTILPFILALGFSLSACAAEEDDDIDLTSTLTIENDSSFALIEIYLSAVGQQTWGSDLLGSSDVLENGEVFEVSGIECDDYDMRIVDEDGDECILDAIDLCLNDESFVIDDAGLIACQNF